MRAASLVALGVVAYGAFLTATVPASFVAGRVERAMPDRVRVHEAHGTLWHGAAQGEVATPGGWVPFENLAWRMQPAQLMRARLAFAIDAQAAGFAAQGVVARTLSAWHAAGDASGTAQSAAAFAPLLSTWRPEGTVTLRTQDFSWDDHEAHGDVQAEWRAASVALSQIRPLGSYRASLHAEGPRARLDVATIEGPLRITGQGELSFASRFTFDGEARAEGGAAASLDPLLDLLGPRRADGARTIAWRAS